MKHAFVCKQAKINSLCERKQNIKFNVSVELRKYAFLF